MSYWDEDFYQEPSEFEQQVDEFKQTLLSAVKEEYKAEMEHLRKENAELWEVKKKMKQFEEEHEQKIRELNWAKQDALNIVRREKLDKLMESLYVKVYKSEWYREELPKCDNCNENRQIEFFSPSGKRHVEDCQCKKGKKKYRPEEQVCVEFHSKDGKVSAWYKPSDYVESDHMISSDHMDNLHDDIPFHEIKSSWYAFFLDESKCQAYCDWLTEQEGEK